MRHLHDAIDLHSQHAGPSLHETNVIQLSVEPSTNWTSHPKNEAHNPDVDEVDPPMAYRIRLIRRAAELQMAAQRNLKAAQDKYKRDHDKKVSFGPTYAPGDYVFLNPPPLKMSAAECPALDNYTKLMPTAWVISSNKCLSRNRQNSTRRCQQRGEHESHHEGAEPTRGVQ